MNEVLQLNNIEMNDPYEVFGHGIVSYFSTLRSLMVVLAFMTVIFLPVMYINSKSSFLRGQLNGYTSKVCIGNLGQADTKCVF